MAPQDEHENDANGNGNGAGNGEQERLLNPNGADLERGNPRNYNGSTSPGLPSPATAKRKSSKSDSFLPPHVHQRRNVIKYFLPLLFGAALLLYYLSQRSQTLPHEPSDSGEGAHVNPVFTLPPPSDIPRSPAFETKAEHGAVASEEIRCSDMGVEVLKEGGNAVDAGIAAAFCVGVLNSFSSGIGGGGFLLIRAPPMSSSIHKGSSQLWSNSDTYSTFLATQSSLAKDTPAAGNKSAVIAIDFRETSPAASTADMYLPIPYSSQIGGLSVGVPGELLGLYTAFEQYGSGRVSWKRLLRPNWELAERFQVSRELARRFRIFGEFMEDKPEWGRVFRPLGGAMAVEGDWIRRTNYSSTLKWVGEHGIDGFYGKAKEEKDNWMVESSVAKIKEEGGVLVRKDFEDYRVRVYEAIGSSYQGKMVYTTDAPSCGPVMLGLFNTLEHYNLSAPHATPNNSTRTPLNMHRLVEALKFSFAARTEISDPFVDGEGINGKMGDERRETIRKFWETKEFGREIWANITDDKTHTAEYYSPKFEVPYDSGTTHMSVVDKWGGAVSITSTVNLIFGSRVMDETTGIIFNDEQDDFSSHSANAFGLKPSPYNFPTPGKRPLSSTAATIVEREDGSLYTALGGSGGSRIYGAVVQVLLNLEWGMGLSEAVEQPRLHDQLYPPVVTIESYFEDEFIDDLKARGHNTTVFDINLGIAEVQAVMIDLNGTIWGASDSRKRGISAGY